METIVQTSFYLLISLIPLFFTTINSELFEIPKFTLLVIISSIIATAYILDSIQNKNKTKTPKNETILKNLFIIFLLTQTISTIFSIHPYTSFWGYYTRINQGLFTTIIYTILSFAYLKYMNKQSTHKFINISIYTSFIISIYAILERMGIDKNIWVQDVVNRPFSTLGQPNWLAAYLLPNIYFSLYKKYKKQLINQPQKPLDDIIIFTLISGLILTKSRSAYLAFTITIPIYFILNTIHSKQKIKTIK